MFKDKNWDKGLIGCKLKLDSFQYSLDNKLFGIVELHESVELLRSDDKKNVALLITDLGVIELWLMRTFEGFNIGLECEIYSRTSSFAIPTGIFALNVDYAKKTFILNQTHFFTSRRGRKLTVDDEQVSACFQMIVD